MMHKKNYHILFLFICLFSAGAVYSEPESLDQLGELKFHAIYSEEMQDIMQRMNQLIYEKELNESQKKERRMQHLQNLIDTASELVIAAESLTEALPGFALNQMEKDVFQAMAMQLKLEAINIRIFAEMDSYTDVDLAYERLNDTCIACHELFRF